MRNSSARPAYAIQRGDLTARSASSRSTSYSDIVADGVHRAQEITRRASTTFYVASCFLSRMQRHAIWTIYAFCRLTDDIVDAALQTPARLERLAEWESRVATALAGSSRDSVLAAFAKTVHDYDVPHEPIFALIDGVRRDLTRNRYETYEELLAYCDLVASTVGLLILPVLGVLHNDAKRCAIALGRAMQLTNILRDVGEDAALGRIYLPLVDLAQFECTEADILEGRINERVTALLKLQIARARELYREAAPGIVLLHPRSRYTVRLAMRLYASILDRIETNGYDVFGRRAFVPNSAKVIIAMQERLRRTRSNASGEDLESL